MVPGGRRLGDQHRARQGLHLGRGHGDAAMNPRRMWVWTRCGLGRGFALVVLCAATSPTEFVPAPISGPAVAGAAVPSPRLFRGFIPNQGQWETEARFVADFGDLLVRAEPGAIIVQKEERLEDHTRVAVVRLAFDGA